MTLTAGRRILVRFLLVIATSSTTFFVAYTAYVKYCELQSRDVRLFANHRLFQQIYIDRDFLRFMSAASSRRTLETQWDFNRPIYLSRDLFDEIEMDGRTKYRYRPRIRKLDVAAWSGLQVVKSSVVENARIDELLTRVHVIRAVSVETDRFGFKCTDFTVTEGAKAIVFLGDSFTEGLFASSSETFANIVGHKIAATGAPLIPINTGVDGYGAAEMAWTLEQFAPKFNPLIVVVNLFPNDVDANYINAIQGVDVPESSYAALFADLGRIERAAASHHSRLVISMIPPKDQLTAIPVEGEFQRRVAAWCNSEHLECINPLNYFRTLGESHVYLAWDHHFSAEGHSHYAEFLSQNLAGQAKATQPATHSP